MDIGQLKFLCMDLDKEVTIREYLVGLLIAVWQQKEGFSGKRPFGNSGWEWDLFKPLIENGIVNGKLDEDGHIEKIDEEKANKVILDCIEALEGK